MSDGTETPQQRQARIRQQKRQAKVTNNAQDRLNSIASISGRSVESLQNASAASSSTFSQSPASAPNNASSIRASSLFSSQANDPEQMRLQEEYVKLLLGGDQSGQSGQPNQTGQGQQRPGMPDENDPMLKLMQGILGGMSGDPNAPATGDLPFSPDELAKMTGMPSFLTSMFMGGKSQAPPTPAQISSERTWRLVRVLVAILTGLYTSFIVSSSVTTFGDNPPAPATVQNPFLVFLTGQLLVRGTQSVLASKPATQGGFKKYLQYGREVGNDAAISIFLLGVYSWWHGYA
ncbi:hypothetical protein LTS08_004272 [Lithohypha guttulata]|nr:hypothetical protein LTS08_004272 [Lithohypha guttulata]